MVVVDELHLIKTRIKDRARVEKCVFYLRMMSGPGGGGVGGCKYLTEIFC